MFPAFPTPNSGHRESLVVTRSGSRVTVSTAEPTGHHWRRHSDRRTVTGPATSGRTNAYASAPQGSREQRHRPAAELDGRGHPGRRRDRRGCSPIGSGSVIAFRRWTSSPGGRTPRSRRWCPGRPAQQAGITTGGRRDQRDRDRRTRRGRPQPVAEARSRRRPGRSRGHHRADGPDVQRPARAGRHRRAGHRDRTLHAGLRGAARGRPGLLRQVDGAGRHPGLPVGGLHVAGQPGWRVGDAAGRTAGRRRAAHPRRCDVAAARRGDRRAARSAQAVRGASGRAGAAQPDRGAGDAIWGCSPAGAGRRCRRSSRATSTRRSITSCCGLRSVVAAAPPPAPASA